MKKKPQLRREVLVDLAPADLVRVNGAGDDTFGCPALTAPPRS